MVTHIKPVPILQFLNQSARTDHICLKHNYISKSMADYYGVQT